MISVTALPRNAAQKMQLSLPPQFLPILKKTPKTNYRRVKFSPLLAEVCSLTILENIIMQRECYFRLCQGMLHVLKTLNLREGLLL